MSGIVGHCGLLLPEGTPGPPGTPHTYWRLYIDAADGSAMYCGFTELEMMTSVGGSTVTSGGAAIFSTDVGGNQAFQAFDGNLTSSGWLSSGGVTNEWCGYDFGFFNPTIEVDIVQIAIYTSWNVPTGSPKDFRLQWSDDGVSWTDALTVTGQTGWGTSPPERRVFNV